MSVYNIYDLQYLRFTKIMIYNIYPRSFNGNHDNDQLLKQIGHYNSS